MPDLEYTFYMEHPHCHWFCSECEAPALKSVQTDMEIEERCSEFMKVYDERLQKVETDLTNKAEKTVVDKLSADLVASQNTMKGLISDVTKNANKLDLIINEQEEIVRRQNNIIIKGLDLDNRQVENVAYELFEEMGQNVIIKNAFAIRKGERKLENDTEDPSGEQPNSNSSGSIVKVTFETLADKQKIMKAAPSLRELESEAIDASNIFITPDLTKLQREKDAKNRKELKKRRAVNPRWKLRNGRLYLPREEDQAV